MSEMQRRPAGEAIVADMGDDGAPGLVAYRA
jgi:hypothetical protein